VPCIFHPLVETPAGCKACFNSWPESYRKNITRARCKRLHWVGVVDTVTTSEYQTVRDRTSANPIKAGIVKE